MTLLYISLGFIIGFYTLKLYLKYNVKGVKKDTKLKNTTCVPEIFMLKFLLLWKLILHTETELLVQRIYK